MRHGLAIGCWALAWACAGLIPAAWFAALDGRGGRARAQLAGGAAGAAGWALTGALLW